jgi:hypothetical protein
MTRESSNRTCIFGTEQKYSSQKRASHPLLLLNIAFCSLIAVAGNGIAACALIILNLKSGNCQQKDFLVLYVLNCRI